MDVSVLVSFGRIMTRIFGWTALMLSVFILQCADSYGQTSESEKSLVPGSQEKLTALEIMMNVEERDEGDNVILNYEMTLIDRNGRRRKRKANYFQKYFGANDRYTFGYINYPPDIRGTALLAYDYDASEREDEQWIYLPQLKNVKRIGSRDKTASFLGSDITFADLTERKARDYFCKMVKENIDVRGWKCWLIEMKPRTQRETDRFGYTNNLIWVHKDSFVVVRSIHWMKEKDKKKYFDLYKLEKHEGVWFQTDFSMTTMKKDYMIHRTEAKYMNIRLNQNMPESIFTVSQLPKGLPE